MGKYILILLSVLISTAVAPGKTGSGNPPAKPAQPAKAAAAPAQGNSPPAASEDASRNKEFQTGAVVYDLINSKMGIHKGQDVIVDARDISLANIVQLIESDLAKKPEQSLLHGFGALLVRVEDGTVEPLKPVRQKLADANIRLYAFIPEDMVKNKPRFTIAEMKVMITEKDQKVQGFFLDKALTKDAQEAIANKLRQACLEVIPEPKRSEIYKEDGENECQMLVHDYDTQAAATMNTGEIKNMEAAKKLLHTGRFINNSYPLQIAAALSGNIDNFLKIHEGGEFLNPRSSTNWADYFLVNPLLASGLPAGKESHALAQHFAWPYGLPKLDGFLTVTESKTGPPTFALKQEQLIKKLLKFREVVAGRPVNHFGSAAGGHVVYYARDQKGFVVMNNSGKDETITVQTRLPPKKYKDVLSGTVEIDVKKEVKNAGEASIKVPKNSVLIFQNEAPLAPPPVAPSNFKVTEILLHAPQTNPGEYIFLRGAWEQNTDRCSVKGACDIPIIHDTPSATVMHSQYNDCKVNNDKLQWVYHQPDQGSHNGVIFEGVPMVWTTNQADNPLCSKSNSRGPGYWYLRFKMRCPKEGTEKQRPPQTTFYVKAISNAWWAKQTNEGWEGTQAESGQNHVVECGKRNVIEWGNFKKVVTEDIPKDAKRSMFIDALITGNRFVLVGTQEFDKYLNKLQPPAK